MAKREWGRRGEGGGGDRTITVEFAVNRQQVEPNGKYADVCKCVMDRSP